MISEQGGGIRYLNPPPVIEPVTTVSFITFMNLTIIISMTILSETAAEYPDLSHHTIPWLSQGIVLWKFFELREQNLSEEPPSATIIEH